MVPFRNQHTIPRSSPGNHLGYTTGAGRQDVADLALVGIPHRTGGETADDQRRKAEHVLPLVVSGLIQI